MNFPTPATGRRCTTAIIETVAGAEGKSALDLPPLYEVIDPDCLDRLVEHGGDITISFTYCGYQVRVKNGQVELNEEATAPTPHRN